ncbi:hypothetical protein MTO96_015013 [Rhipicephalus appendiculatus]
MVTRITVASLDSTARGLQNNIRIAAERAWVREADGEARPLRKGSWILYTATQDSGDLVTIANAHKKTAVLCGQAFGSSDGISTTTTTRALPNIADSTARGLQNHIRIAAERAWVREADGEARPLRKGSWILYTATQDSGDLVTIANAHKKTAVLCGQAFGSSDGISTTTTTRALPNIADSTARGLQNHIRIAAERAWVREADGEARPLRKGSWILYTATQDSGDLVTIANAHKKTAVLCGQAFGSSDGISTTTTTRALPNIADSTARGLQNHIRIAAERAWVREADGEARPLRKGSWILYTATQDSGDLVTIANAHKKTAVLCGQAFGSSDGISTTTTTRALPNIADSTARGLQNHIRIAAERAWVREADGEARPLRKSSWILYTATQDSGDLVTIANAHKKTAVLCGQAFGSSDGISTTTTTRALPNIADSTARGLQNHIRIAAERAWVREADGEARPLRKGSWILYTATQGSGDLVTIANAHKKTADSTARGLQNHIRIAAERAWVREADGEARPLRKGSWILYTATQDSGDLVTIANEHKKTAVLCGQAFGSSDGISTTTTTRALPNIAG